MNAIVACHDAGLFSLINKVMVCLDRYERVHVDFSRGLRCLYAPEGVNLWEHLFLPTEPCDGEEIIEYPDDSMTSIQASSLYAQVPWKWKYNAHWQRVTVRPEILAEAEAFIAQNWPGKDVISMLVRANTHAYEQIENRSQTLEEYWAAFEKIAQPETTLHVMACDEETIHWFKEKLPRVTAYPFTRRAANRDLDCHLQDQQTISDARMALVEVLILSRARYLIHPTSNMATAALYMNPHLQSVYLR